MKQEKVFLNVLKLPNKRAVDFISGKPVEKFPLGDNFGQVDIGDFYGHDLSSFRFVYGYAKVEPSYALPNFPCRKPRAYLTHEGHKTEIFCKDVGGGSFAFIRIRYCVNREGKFVYENAQYQITDGEKFKDAVFCLIAGR